MENFKQWFKENLLEYAKDIVEHGADCGFPYITYTSDTVKLWDKYGKEIWEYAVDEAESLGCKNVAEMISCFKRSDMLTTLDGFYNLMIWYGVELIAYEIAYEIEEEEEKEKGD